MRAMFLAWLASAALACAPTPATAPAAHNRAPPAMPAATTVPAPPPAAEHAPLFAPAPPGERALVLWTASVQGYVEPCGCTAYPLGGVARLAGAVQDAQRAYGERVVLLDGGDLLFERADDNAAVDRCQAEARADLLVDTLARIGLRATVQGPLDDARGSSFRDARLAQAGILTVGVGAARPLGDGARGAPHTLIDAGGVKVGVTAFSAESAADAPAARAALAREVAALLDEGARAVVALAQAPRAVTRLVALGMPGVDAVLQGRAPGELPLPPEPLVGGDGVGPVLLAAGMQAQHLGALELVLDGRVIGAPLPQDHRSARDQARRRLLDVKHTSLSGEIARELDLPRRAFLQQRLQAVQAERAELDARAAHPTPLVGPHLRAWSVPLPRGSAEEPAAAAALAAYQASIPALVARCEADAPCPAAPPGTPTYVGANACRACHAAAVAFWTQQTVRRPGKDARGNAVMRTVGHARAWDTLVLDGKERDRSCVPCHAVGFGQPGGPCKTSDVVRGGYAGVQCESCHGPGSIHATAASRDSIVRAPGEERCRSCHKVPHIATTESFVFEDRRRLIVGPGHGQPLTKEPAP